MELKANIDTVFFDLDNTLFDHDRAERNALIELVGSPIWPFSDIAEGEFIDRYQETNSLLWARASRGEVPIARVRDLRFELIVKGYGGAPKIAPMLSTEYIRLYTGQNAPCPNSAETLGYLESRYRLGILSSGYRDIQTAKLGAIGLAQHFRFFVYSGDIGVSKPHRRIFDTATDLAGISPEAAIYIGDSYEDDIVGAKEAGWSAVFYNPSGGVVAGSVADHEIANLNLLRSIL